MENTDVKNSKEWSYDLKWGNTKQAGFTSVPNTLIKAQSELGLTNNDLVVLINLIMHWWEPQELPFPRTSTIAKRTGMSVRTVQRSMSQLQKLGYINRETRNEKTYANLDGIKEKLLELSDKHLWKRAKSNSQIHEQGGGFQAANL